MKNMFLIVFIISFASCSKNEENSYVDIPEEQVYNPTLLKLEIPDNFPEATYDFTLNPPTQEGFDLGKELFYEGELSSDGLISCGECHRQDFAFTHHTHVVSHGVDGALGTRNAQPLHNLAFMKEFTWDGAVNDLDRQPITPITAPVEMNETFDNVINKLKKDKEYPKLFAVAFENGQIDTENILRALAQFIVMMVSGDSKYDRAVRQEGNITFTSEELLGKAVFEAKCATCHATSLFTDQSYRNNGLPVDPQYNDLGHENVSGLAIDKYKFKVPSLRNIELTLPYMHDGRFKTLENVIDFYRSGITDSETLDPALKKDNKLGIPISDEEKTQLIAFLKTLTDTNFAQDNRFSEF